MYQGDWEDFLDKANEVISDAEEVPERGEDFAHSVIEKVQAISETVEQHESVSAKQWKALENMHRGVQRWLR